MKRKKTLNTETLIISLKYFSGLGLSIEEIQKIYEIIYKKQISKSYIQYILSNYRKKDE